MLVSLDTNAIIDFCYRTYPRNTFPSIWSNVQSYTSSGMVIFHECNSVHLEVEELIASYQYDINIYQEFISDFRVRKIEPDKFSNKTLEVKTKLLSFPATRKSPHVDRDNYADADIVSLALYLQNDCLVLSSEQKNLSFDSSRAGNPNSLKVPNLCEIFAAKSGNWNTLFEAMGMLV